MIELTCRRIDWKVSINHFFLKGNRLKVSLISQNLLNQQTLVRRFNQNYAVIENQFNNLGRYFLLSIVYKITKAGAPKGRKYHDIDLR